MQLFSCQGCSQTVFFESVQCIKCSRSLAYLSDRGAVAAIEPVPLVSDGSSTAVDGNGAHPAAPVQWRIVGENASPIYRLCRNQTEQGTCNWAVADGDPGDFCRACRLNHMIPNLNNPDTKAAWHRLEIAKRRTLYTLYRLELPVEGKAERPDGLQFDFLQDSTGPGSTKVLTGHVNGVITINAAEADDPFREKMRVQLGETYRTLLGHFRHEIGHYYWDRLIAPDETVLNEFRALFGDEREDYAGAQKRHYADGPPADWPTRFVSAYASMHPWEDWAETWAHYLHIFDTLETARAHGVSLRPAMQGPNAAGVAMTARRLDPQSFDDLIRGWIPLTTALNNLNRSMGLSDCYPFVLTELAITKLRFVHERVHSAAPSTQAAA